MNCLGIRRWRASGPGEMEKVLQTYTVHEKWAGYGRGVPSWSLFKAPHGRHRARVVICGHMLTAMNGEKERTPVDKKEQTRRRNSDQACLAEGGAREVGNCGGGREGRIPPSTKKGDEKDVNYAASAVSPASRKGAMYGLDSSPADWAAFRDASLKNFTWQNGGAHYSLISTSESNLWSVVEKKNGGKSGKVVGQLVVYVDDMMVCGPDSVVQGCLDRIAREWSCSQPEWVSLEKWIKFCGFELRWGERGLLLGQPSYIGELAQRHGVQQPRPVPFSKPEVPEGADVNAENVKKAQGLVGELLWLSVRTRPDISFRVAWMAQHITKCPQLVVKAAEEMVGYLLIRSH